MLSSKVSQLVSDYSRMDETGIPFGTLVIAEMAQKMIEKGEDVILCAESIISTEAPDEVIEETIKNLRAMARGPEAPFLGLPELRVAIAKRFERLYGQKVDWRNEVIVTAGSMQAEFYLMNSLLDPGDEVIIPVPTFFFDIPVKLAQGKCVFVKLDPSNGYYHDAKKFEQLITERTKMIVLCNPHNPTGRVLTREELSNIIKIVRKYDLFLMHDQVYENIVFDDREYITAAHFANEIPGRLISISSFSKLFNMINYRLGYAIGPSDVIKGMEVIHAFSSMGIPSLLQKGAIAALDEEFEKKHLSRTIKRLQEARDYAIKRLNGLDKVSFVPPQGTNLLLLDISRLGMNSMEFCKYLLKKAKVACAPGVAYHAEGFIRVSLGSDRSEEAIDRIASAIEELAAKG